MHIQSKGLIIFVESINFQFDSLILLFSPKGHRTRQFFNVGCDSRGHKDLYSSEKDSDGIFFSAYGTLLTRLMTSKQNFAKEKARLLSHSLPQSDAWLSAAPTTALVYSYQRRSSVLLLSFD